MDFRFETIEYVHTAPSCQTLWVYKVFDTQGKLIVLDKTGNLFNRFLRYFGERSEHVRDLDLREITGRIEYIKTDSAFETLYILYRERKDLFPKTHRKMRTFRLFTLIESESEATIPPHLREPPNQARRGLLWSIPFTRPIHAS